MNNNKKDAVMRDKTTDAVALLNILRQRNKTEKVDEDINVESLFMIGLFKFIAYSSIFYVLLITHLFWPVMIFLIISELVGCKKDKY